jgi:hypothetical protein
VFSYISFFLHYQQTVVVETVEVVVLVEVEVDVVTKKRRGSLK